MKGRRNLGNPINLKINLLEWQIRLSQMQIVVCDRTRKRYGGFSDPQNGSMWMKLGEKVKRLLLPHLLPKYPTAKFCRSFFFVGVFDNPTSDNSNRKSLHLKWSVWVTKLRFYDKLQWGQIVGQIIPSWLFFRQSCSQVAFSCRSSFSLAFCFGDISRLRGGEFTNFGS